MAHCPKRRGWTQWALGGAGLVLGVASAYLILQSQSRPTAAPPQPRSTVSTALYIQHDGGALRLHWDPGVRATTGAIRIHDGARESRLDLNAAELRSGVASYWPESSEVTFQMELDGTVVGAIRAPATAVSRPHPVQVEEKPRAKKAVARPVKLAARDPEDEPDDVEPESPKRSRWSKVTGKIPLLRRLGKH